MDEAWRYEAHRQIEQKVLTIASAHGAKAEIEIKIGYPCLQNDEELTSKLKQQWSTFRSW